MESRTARTAADLGAHLATWRKLQGLTAQQVAERAGITRGTLRRLETGETPVGTDTLIGVVRALGLTNRLIDALDPYETDFGRARANVRLPQRVRNAR